MAFLLLKDNNCAKFFRNPCINIEVMARTNPDGRMHARTHLLTHAHTPNKNCINYISLTASGFDIKTDLALTKSDILCILIWSIYLLGKFLPSFLESVNRAVNKGSTNLENPVIIMHTATYISYCCPLLYAGYSFWKILTAHNL